MSERGIVFADPAKIVRRRAGLIEVGVQFRLEHHGPVVEAHFGHRQVEADLSRRRRRGRVGGIDLRDRAGAKQEAEQFRIPVLFMPERIN